MRLLLARATIAILLLAAGAAEASPELDGAQAKLLAEATQHLTQGEANLRVAQGGLGTAPVSRSKAQLALTRLGSVKTSIAQADARLDRLPKDDPSVVTARTRSTALAAAVKDLETSLTGAPTPPAASPGGATTIPLDYRQQEALKNARFHTTEVTGKAAAIAALVEEIGQAPDPLRVDRRRLAAGTNTLVDARRKATQASEHLAALPAQGAGVAEVAAALAKALASLDASAQVLTPLETRLASLLDPAKLPALSTDTKRLRELAAMYADEQLLERDRPQAAAALGEMGEAVKEHDRIVALYALLIDQQTEEGEALAAASRHFRAQLEEFRAAAVAVQAALPAGIDAAIADANRLADVAVAEQKPAYFGGGIPQAVAEAEDRILLLAALDPAAAKTKAASLDALKASLQQRQASLRAAIIAANTPAEDRYAGPDRASLEATATAAWKKLQSDAQVLRIVIPSAAWKRETSWRHRHSDWVFEDRSKLQVQLLVRFDDALAVLRPINLVKDHTEGDTITAYPMDGPRDEVAPQRLIPLGKVR